MRYEIDNLSSILYVFVTLGCQIPTCRSSGHDLNSEISLILDLVTNEEEQGVMEEVVQIQQGAALTGHYENNRPGSGITYGISSGASEHSRSTRK